MNLIAAAIILGLCGVGTSIGNSNVISRTIENTARQPEMKSVFQSLMYIGVGLVEAFPIIALVFALIIMQK